MLVFFTVVHILLSVFMILVILLQPGKDAGMGAALGGGAATSAFGGRGAATFLTKLTAFCAMGFFLTSLGLSFVGLRTSVADSIVGSTVPAAVPSTPVAPAAAPSTKEESDPTAAPAEDGPKASDSIPGDTKPKDTK
jgi:preprotein translocase subunit SecG